MILSIIIFFFIIWGLGVGIQMLLRYKESESAIEQVIMRMGAGIVLWTVLIHVFDLVGIALNWKLFFGLSLIGPLVKAYQLLEQKNRDKLTKFWNIKNIDRQAVIAILFGLIIFIVYLKGSFAYEWLEDGDPWEHAMGIKYVKLYETFHYEHNVQPPSRYPILHYLAPYSPAYDALIGIMHQMTVSTNATLKVYNVILIALAHIFFYFFAKQIFGNKNKALFAAFVLMITPPFLSHFIWSSTLAIMLFFPAFYFIDQKDKRYFILSILAVAAVLVSQPSNAAIFGMLFALYWLCRVVIQKKFNWLVFLIGGLGLAVSWLIYWMPQFLYWGIEGAKIGIGLSTSVLHFNAAGAGGGLLYYWKDFLFASAINKIDNPIGFGIFIYTLTVFSIGLLYGQLKNRFKKAGMLFWIVAAAVSLYGIFAQWNDKPELTIFAWTVVLFGVGTLLAKGKADYWKITLLAWTLLSFAGIHSNRLPYQLMPYRWWAILAIPVALMAVEGFFYILKQAPKLRIKPVHIGIVMVILLCSTSAYEKYENQTALWPPGELWYSGDQLAGYARLLALPPDTRVMPLCNWQNYADRKVIGFDKMTDFVDLRYRAFRDQAINKSAEEIHAYTQENNFAYVIMDVDCARLHGENATRIFAQELITSGRFGLEYANFDVFIFSTNIQAAQLLDDQIHPDIANAIN